MIILYKILKSQRIYYVCAKKEPGMNLEVVYINGGDPAVAPLFIQQRAKEYLYRYYKGCELE